MNTTESNTEKLIYTPPVETVAGELCHILHQWLGPVKMAAVVAENARRKQAGDDSSCATHDYCDANVAMDEAFKLTTGQHASAMLQDDAALRLWSQAWDLAAKSNFTTTRPPYTATIHIPGQKARKLRFASREGVKGYIMAYGGKVVGTVAVMRGREVVALM